MKKIKSLYEAQQFFLAKGYDPCECVAGENSQICQCYKDAEDFFQMIDRQKKALYAEKTALLDKYGIFGGGQLVNGLHRQINLQLEALGVVPNS